MVIKHTVTSQTQITGWSPWPDFCFHSGTWWRTNRESPWTSVQEHSRSRTLQMFFWNTEILSNILDRMFYGSPRSHHSVLVRDENHKQFFQRCGSLFSDRLTELPNIFLTAETDTRSSKTQVEVEPVGEPVEPLDVRTSLTCSFWQIRVQAAANQMFFTLRTRFRQQLSHTRQGTTIK